MPAWVRSPERLREAQRGTWPYLLAMLGGFGAPTGATLLFMQAFAPTGTGGLAALIALGGMALSFAGLFATCRWATERLACRQAQKALEGAALDADAVGVTYADGFWHDALIGDSWDWGALRLGFDRLEFAGRASRFELRPEDVVGVQARWSDYLLGSPVARLYLRYVGAKGVETVGIELPYVRSARRRVERVEELRDRIERWRLSPLPALDAEPSRLPLDGAEARVERSRYERIGRRAKWLAFAAVLPIWLAIQVAMTLVLTLMGYSKAGVVLTVPALFFCLALWIMLAARIERGLPERLRFQEPKMGLREAVAEPETETLVQR